MKRLPILAIILAALSAICLGQYDSRPSRVKKIIQLSPPKLAGRLSLEETLAKRRSVRAFTSQPLEFEQIGQLAWAGQGITERQKGFRTAPSAGAIYPIKLYFVIQKGIFVYNPDEHSLEEILSEDVRAKLEAAALEQETVSQAPCNIVIAGSVKEVAAKYGDKAKRFMLLEAGHIAQNIQLQAVSLDLGSVTVGAFDINKVRKVCNLPITLEPLYIICVGYPVAQTKTQEGKEEKETQKMDTKKTKKAVLIVASRDFRDEELFETKGALNQAGIETVIASSKTGALRGMLGGRADTAILVKDVKPDDYDAIIFIGGSGASEYFDSPVALDIARQAAQKKKVLAAICIAPSVLANAGVLNGLKVTSFASERGNLQRAGARYTGAAVEQDGLIITGSGPAAASQFGQAVVQALKDK